MRFINNAAIARLVRWSRALVWLTVIGLALPGLRAQSTNSVPLPEELFPQLQPILIKALSQSTAMLTASSAITQAEASQTIANSMLLPRLETSTFYSSTTSIVALNTDIMSRANGLFYSLALSQPVFQWGTYKAQVDSAKIGVLIAEKNYAEAYRLLALSIRSQFFGLIIKKKVLRNAEFALKLATADLRLEEEKLRNGTSAPGNLIGPQMSVEEARLSRDRVAADLDQARRLFGRLTGAEIMQESFIPDELVLAGQYYSTPFAEPMLAKFAGDGVEHTFQAQIYRDYVRQADLTYKVVKYRLYPKFSLSALYSQQSITNAAQDYVAQVAVNTQTVSLMAVWNIFDGFATKGAKVLALTSKRTYERQLENHLLISLEQARDLERALAFSARAMQLADTRRDLQWSAVELGNQDLARGEGSQRVLEARTQAFYQSELGAFVARADFLTQWATFISSLNRDPALKNLPARFSSHAQ